MIIGDFHNCEGCAHRRELITRWAADWVKWAQDPIHNPRPGSKEWLRVNGQKDLPNPETGHESRLTSPPK